jgi:hypothetical protein
LTFVWEVGIVTLSPIYDVKPVLRVCRPMRNRFSFVNRARILLFRLHAMRTKGGHFCA